MDVTLDSTVIRQPGFDSLQGWEGIFFSSEPRSDRLWGPDSLISDEQGVLSPDLKRPGREADYSPPSSEEIKNDWSYTPTPTNVFMV
jgi:hypothetical protein